MKTLSLTVLFGAILLAARFAPAADKWESQWKKVDEAVNQGLPKTAVERLQPILDGAIAEKNYPVAIKAIGRKIALEGNIQGNKPEEKIIRLEAEIPKAPAAMQPMLEVIQADWYWQYFLHNRWRFMQRTATAAAPGKDFTTWDLPRLFAEIGKHFQKALSAADQLKKIPVEAFGDLLDKGTMPDSWRPTLYDFVAQRALDFYSSGEQAAAKPEDAFELSADSPIFRPADEFVDWKVKTGDTDSPALKAVRLYQDLLRFHEKDDDRTAFLAADLDRLNFGNNLAVGEEKAALYKLALRRFIKEGDKHAVSAIARYHLASVLRQEGSLTEAHAIAKQGERAFPNTPGGNLCFNLIKQIEAKSASVVTERVWNKPAPSIRVTYCNLSKVYLRLVRDEWRDRIKDGQYRGEWLDDNQRRAILARQPDMAWSADLPTAEDYQERVEDLPAPLDVKPGRYYLLASYDPGFSNVVSCTEVWVSKLALVVRSAEAQFAGFVLDADSGEPQEGAEVQVYAWDWNGHFGAGEKTKTDGNGRFSVRGETNKNNLLYVTHAGQELATANNMYAFVNNYRYVPQKQVVFFTDRSLYRPGQAIYFKGIAMLVDQEGDNYKTCPGEAVNVVFSDVNGKEIARQSLRTNDYGSFSGNFTAPRDRLMGRMMLRSENIPGNGWVSVEEYKRPKFQVTLDAPKTAARLGGEVQTRGQGRGLHRRDGGRGQGPLPRRPPGPLSRLVVLVLRLADAAADRRSGNCPRHGGNRGRRHLQDQLHRQARPFRAGERRTDLPLRDLGRRDRHQRRDPLGGQGGRGGLHGPAGLAFRPRMADHRQAFRNHSHDHDLGRRAPTGRRLAEDLPAQAAGKGRAARYPWPAADQTHRHEDDGSRRAKGPRTCRNGGRTNDPRPRPHQSQHLGTG